MLPDIDVVVGRCWRYHCCYGVDYIDDVGAWLLLVIDLIRYDLLDVVVYWFVVVGGWMIVWTVTVVDPLRCDCYCWWWLWYGDLLLFGCCYLLLISLLTFVDVVTVVVVPVGDCCGGAVVVTHCYCRVITVRVVTFTWYLDDCYDDYWLLLIPIDGVVLVVEHWWLWRCCWRCWFVTMVWRYRCWTCCWHIVDYGNCCCCYCYVVIVPIVVVGVDLDCWCWAVVGCVRCWPYLLLLIVCVVTPWRCWRYCCCYGFVWLLPCYTFDYRCCCCSIVDDCVDCCYDLIVGIVVGDIVLPLLTLLPGCCWLFSVLLVLLTLRWLLLVWLRCLYRSCYCWRLLMIRFERFVIVWLFPPRLFFRFVVVVGDYIVGWLWLITDGGVGTIMLVLLLIVNSHLPLLLLVIVVIVDRYWWLVLAVVALTRILSCYCYWNCDVRYGAWLIPVVVAIVPCIDGLLIVVVVELLLFIGVVPVIGWLMNYIVVVVQFVVVICWTGCCWLTLLVIVDARCAIVGHWLLLLVDLVTHCWLLRWFGSWWPVGCYYRLIVDTLLLLNDGYCLVIVVTLVLELLIDVIVDVGIVDCCCWWPDVYYVLLTDRCWLELHC